MDFPNSKSHIPGVSQKTFIVQWRDLERDGIVVLESLSAGPAEGPVQSDKLGQCTAPRS